MEIRHLEELVVFARTMNYSAAARELFISQPALSAHISKMESELGFGIVTHDGDPRLTVAGKLFVARVQEMLAGYGGIVEACRSVAARESRSVRILDLRTVLAIIDDIVAATSAADGGAPASISYVDQVKYGQLSELDLLDQRIVDFAFLYAAHAGGSPFSGDEPAETYGAIALRPEPCFVRLSRDSGMGAGGTITREELAGLTLTVCDQPIQGSAERAIQAVLDEAGVHPARIPGDMRSREEFIGAGPDVAGILMGTAAMAPVSTSQFVHASVEGLDLTVYPYAVWRRDNPNPAVEKFARAWERAISRER